MRSFWRVGVRTVAAVLIAGLAQRASAQGFDKWGDAGRERINQGTIGLAAGLPDGGQARDHRRTARLVVEADHRLVGGQVAARLGQYPDQAEGVLVVGRHHSR